ncbi:MAG: Veg family protein [Actinomycetia bacterium]|nr:Veg family protein [Actinomycetes bacterium]
MEAEVQEPPVTRIHDKIVACKGQTLKVKANLGRSKILEYSGVVAEAHDQLFVLEVKRKRGSIERKSYQYVDVLTGTVVLMHGDECEPLFPVPFESQQ